MESRQIFCSDNPEDVISRVQFLNSNCASTLTGDLLVSSWDGNVRLYNSESGDLVSKVNVGTNPILSATSCNPVGALTEDPKSADQFVTGGLSGEVLVAHFSRKDAQPLVLGTHEAPIRCVESVNPDIIATGSWDCHVKLWDLRIKGEAGHASVGGKVFALGISQKAQKIVVCDSLKTVTIFDQRNLSQPESSRDATCPVLKSQLRAVECFPDGMGYTVASVEGRVAWEYFDPALGPNGEKKNYAFKCHREKGTVQDSREIIYPVNALAFHHGKHSFATGGGDGGVIVWDGYSKKRLWKTSELYEGSISSLSFRRTGNVIAIGISDGKKELAKPHIPGKVAIRFLRNEEVTPKSKVATH